MEDNEMDIIPKTPSIIDGVISSDDDDIEADPYQSNAINSPAQSVWSGIQLGKNQDHDLSIPSQTCWIAESQLIPGTDASMNRQLDGNSFKSNVPSFTVNSSKTKKRKFVPNENEIQDDILLGTQSQANLSGASLEKSRIIGGRKFNYFQNQLVSDLFKSGDHNSLLNQNGTSLADKNQTIIVEMLDAKELSLPSTRSSALSSQKAKIFSNDIILQKAIYSSFLSIDDSISIVNITKNLKKNLVVLHFKPISPENLLKILSVVKLGEFRVKCRLPAEEQSIRGVIGPIGIDTPDTDIKRELLNQYDNLIDVQRICRGKEGIPTLSVKLTFSGATLPSEVDFCFQRFKVNLFIGRPWQCYNCQKFGHNANVCKSKSVCAICSGFHKTFDCSQRSLPFEQKAFKCINCLESHSANYGGCKNIKFAKEIENVRAEGRLSYRDALARVKRSQQMNDQNNQRSQTHNPNPQVMEKIIPAKINKSFTGQRDASTQTEPTYVKTNESGSTQGISEILTKTSLLIVSLLQLKSLKKPQKIVNVIKSVMGIDVSTSQVMNCHDDQGSSDSEVSCVEQEPKKSGQVNNRRGQSVKADKISGLSEAEFVKVKGRKNSKIAKPPDPKKPKNLQK